MKAVLLLAIALAIASSCHGLGFPNFRLGCQGYNIRNIERFDVTTPASYIANGAIPYCDLSDPFQLMSVTATKGYSPQYMAANDWVLFRPVFGQQLQKSAFASFLSYFGNGPDFRVRAEVVSVGPTVGPMVSPAIAIGDEVAVNIDAKQCVASISGALFGGQTSFTAIARGPFSSDVFACPASHILGKYENAETNMVTSEGRAQAMIIDKPFIFYGL
jgi:hypothetical protein